MKILKVQDVMSPYVVTVNENDDLAYLHTLMMEHHIRHIPVTDYEGDVVGLVSHRDLLGIAFSSEETLPMTQVHPFLAGKKVREIMITGVETVEAEEEIEEAGRILLENKFGCLPVTENRRIVGMLTEADFVRCLVEEQEEVAESFRSSRKISSAKPRRAATS